MQAQTIFSSTLMRIAFCVVLLAGYTRNNAVLPQPGQNFQSILAAVGTEVDTLAACCAPTFTAIAGVSSLITTDFNNTMTALAAVSSLITTDFNNTMTAIAALTRLETTNSNSTFTALAAISALITADFNATMTVIGTVSTNFNSTYTALAAVSSLITTDFNNTMTALAGVSSSLTTGFNSTFTALAALGVCGPITLSQSSVSNGAILLTTTGAMYCLSQNITGSIIMSAADITVDLNMYSLIGTIDILSTATSAVIQNGNVKPPAPVNSTDASHAAIVIASTVDKSLIKNCYVVCANSTVSGNVGRNGIANGGTNTIIDSCFIQAGAGSGSGVGGDGVIVTNTACRISNCTIIAGAGTSTGGNGITQQASHGNIINNIVTGGAGATTGGAAISQQASNGTLTNNIVTGGSVGGAGISVTAATNLNVIESCLATNGGGNGFTMLTTGTVDLLACVATYNTTSGFDLSASTGKGLIQECVASQNLSCGFRDRSTSAYTYVANVSQGNDSNPAVATRDTNYCWSDFSNTSTFTSPAGPGASPFFQFPLNSTGAALPNLSDWNNVTLK